MDVYKKLDELGIKLMGPTPKGGIYSSVQPYGIIYYMYQEQHLTMQWTKIWRENWEQNIQFLKGRKQLADVW